MKQFKAALPMLANAAIIFFIQLKFGIGHEFGLGVAFGGSLVMALRDAEKS